jgi:hypothetical protein
MTKSERPARKKQRRLTGQLLLRCEKCERVQPFHRGHDRPSGCTRCTHIYGTTAETD